MSDEHSDVQLSEQARQVLAQLRAPVLEAAQQAQLWARVQSSAAAVAAGVGGAALGVKAATIGIALTVGATVGLGTGKVIWDRPAPTETLRLPSGLDASVEKDPDPVELSVAPPVAKTQVPKAAPDNDKSDRAERKLLETARTALLRHDGAAALKALESHRARFASGTFSEERDGLEVQALVMAEKFELARAKGSGFLAKYPNSVFGPSVEAAIDAAK